MSPAEFVAKKIEGAQSLEESSKWLAILCSDDCEIGENGILTLYGRRHLVENIDGLQVTVRSNEHPPPHFHVTGQGIDASFTIETGAHMKGKATAKQLRAVSFWYSRSRLLLVKTWNKTRPSNCNIGPIR